MEEMESIIGLRESRGSDFEAQFGRERETILSKMMKLVWLPLGFGFGIFKFEARFDFLNR